MPRLNSSELTRRLIDLSDARDALCAEEVLSSQGMIAKVESYGGVEKMKAEVKPKQTTYHSPRWGSVQRTEPFDRKALPLARAIRAHLISSRRVSSQSPRAQRTRRRRYSRRFTEMTDRPDVLCGAFY